MFLPFYKYFKTFTGSDKIFAWRSEEFSKESIKTRFTLDISSASKLTFNYNGRIREKFEESCSKQDKVSFTNRNVAQFLIVYE